MSMFYIGGELAQSRLGLPKALTGVFQGLLLFALLACDTLIHYRVVVRPHARWRSLPPKGASAPDRPSRVQAGPGSEA
jgi:general nucleoside transport system permease protein